MAMLSVVHVVPSTTGSAPGGLVGLVQAACQCGATDSKSAQQALHTWGWNGLYTSSTHRLHKLSEEYNNKAMRCGTVVKQPACYKLLPQQHVGAAQPIA